MYALPVRASVILAATLAVLGNVIDIRDIESRASLAKVYTTCKAANTVALTFDDGPYTYETELSDLLTQNGIKATFFVNGNNWDCIYDSTIVANLKYTYNAGHQIASHTWSHAHLPDLTFDQIHDEMWRVELAMKRILGVTPAFMRPPYGEYNDLVRQVSKQRNQSMVTWDLSTGDGDVDGTDPEGAKAVYADAIKQHPSTIMALNHETYQSTVEDVIPYAIKQLKAAGYNFDTVAGCLGLQPYHSTGKPSTPDSSWTC